MQLEPDLADLAAHLETPSNSIFSADSPWFRSTSGPDTVLGRVGGGVVTGLGGGDGL